MQPEVEIIEEILDWQMWQLIAGYTPKSINLSPHHIAALREWARKAFGLAAGDAFVNFGRVFGMQIVKV